MENIKELMQWRFACKSFDSAKMISDEDLNDLLDTARLSPSSFGVQAWKMVVVMNKELREKLAPVCYNQPQIMQASALVFFCARTDLLGEQGMVQKFIESYKMVAGKTDQDVAGYRDMIIGTVNQKGVEGALNWVQKQVYLSVETLILAAAEKGIDSCPMEGFDPAGVAKVLELPEYMHPTVLVSLGYRNMEAPKKVRFALDEVVEIRK